MNPLKKTPLHVKGTAWRPNYLGPFTLSHNRINPHLAFHEDGLTIKVIRTTEIAWEDIVKLEVRKGFFRFYAVVTTNDSDFIARFGNLRHLRILSDVMRDKGIEVVIPAKYQKTIEDASD